MVMNGYVVLNCVFEKCVVVDFLNEKFGFFIVVYVEMIMGWIWWLIKEYFDLVCWLLVMVIFVLIFLGIVVVKFKKLG